MPKRFLLFMAAVTTAPVFAAQCDLAGPQSPRDINLSEGSNPVHFASAPNYNELNLCNIHFHKNAEHRAAAFSVTAHSSPTNTGYQCQLSKALAEHERKPLLTPACDDLQSGDTIEVHWVYSSARVSPGPGLGSCVSTASANPDLRVEAQVFTLVNDTGALNFTEMTRIVQRHGRYQSNEIPHDSGEPVRYLGSTTGPSYSQHQCSPYQVSWSVRPDCRKLDIHSLAKWCEDNPFNEHQAHGVRQLVIDAQQLSTIDD